jgi:hypothetical protein
MKPPIHIVWSTDEVDLADPFQKFWYLKQVLLHGRAEDIKGLDCAEIDSELDRLDLPAHLHDLWASFLRAHQWKG